MDITVNKVQPGMGKVFGDYFAGLEFAHEPHFATCFCRFYHLNTDLDDWKSRSGEQNRNESEEAIEAGEMTGYMAFDGDKAVGWLNANDSGAYPRLQEWIGSTVEGKKVGVVICYVIHPDYRRQGVAGQLLEAAIEGFREDGYQAVLALPVEMKEVSEKDYRGPLSMYEKKGFKTLSTHGDPANALVHAKWLDL